MTTADESVYTFELTVDGVASGALHVTAFTAREALSDGTRLQVQASSGEPPPAPEALLGKAATLRIAHEGETEPRYFHGVVLGAEVEAVQPDAFVLALEIGARIELLRLGRDARIYQDKSVVEVVRDVFARAGLGPEACAWRLADGDYPKRAYTAQYNESDFAFCARLLEAEGIGFAVLHEEAAERVVFFDANGQLEPLPGGDAFVAREAQRGDSGAVTAFRELRAAAPDAAALRDYDPEHPALDLTAGARADGSTGREVYTHRGGYATVAAGRRRARRVLEKLRFGARVHGGRASSPRITPGHTVVISGNRRAALDGAYLVTEAEHRGRTGDAADAYEVTFRAAPPDAAYRPAAGTPPRAPAEVAGAQLAFVTVPAGEEIHADRFGRVKVRFPWDRARITDDRSSAWLRVGQLALGGSMILPRQRFEVLVDFELGDVDRPFVAGHLYNAELAPPYALPGGNTRSSIQTATTQGGSGANELRFEDSAGGEEVFMNASRDLTIGIEHDASWNVTHNQTCKVGANNTLSVGADHHAQVTANRELSVGGPQSVDVGGDYSDGVGGDLGAKVGAVRKVQVGGDHAETAGAKLARTVGGMQVVTGLTGVGRQVTGDSTTTVGAAWTQVSGLSQASACTGSRRETIGALKMVRAKTITGSAGTALTMNAAGMSIRCGDAFAESADGAVAVTTGGGLSVKAADITITAESRLVVIAAGCVIKLSSSGDVSIKAPNIDLRGTEALNQVMHHSN